MTDTCGCCTGVEAITPTAIANRPGLSALAYRTGIHPTFLETMLARLANLGITRGELDVLLYDPAQKDEIIYPLKGLTTRSTDDPAIALLDAWAIIADILTFYQERIANEGYLRTATERRSILELARLVGYTLRPGVAASVFLAYTLEPGQTTTIPKESRSQSLPGPGQFPQSFETSDNIEARAEWNAIKPRMSVPQYITQFNRFGFNFLNMHTADGALYLDGVATQLRDNDALLFVFDETRPDKFRKKLFGGQVFGHVRKVDAHAAEQYTRVELPLELTPLTLLHTISDILAYYLELEKFNLTAQDAQVVAVLPLLNALQNLFQLVELWIELQELQLDSTQTVEQLKTAVLKLMELLGNAKSDHPLFQLFIQPLKEGDVTTKIVNSPLFEAFMGTLTSRELTFSRTRDSSIPDLTPVIVILLNALGTLILASLALWDKQYNDAVTAGHTQAATWVGGLISDLHAQVSTIPAVDTREDQIGIITLLGSAAASYTPYIRIPVVTTSIAALVKPLGKSSSLQPVNSTRLQRNKKDTFARKGDIAPQLISKLNLAVDDSVYQAYANAAVSTKPTLQKVYAFRVKAVPFGTPAPRKASTTKDKDDANKFTTSYDEWMLNDSGQENPEANVLDLDATHDQIVPHTWIVIHYPPTSLLHPKAPLVCKILSVDTYTRAGFGMSAQVTRLTLDQPWFDSSKATLLSDLRGITVYTQSEELPLAEEPLTDDISDGEIELDGLYNGLQSGRWAVVSGERTDIPNTSGLRTSELVMLESVRQNTRNTQEMPEDATLQKQAVRIAADAAPPPEAELGAAGAPPPPLPHPIPLPLSPPPLSLPGDTIHTVLKFAKPLSFTYKRATVTVAANVVKATHGETHNEVLGSGDASKRLQQFVLRQFPLTYTSAPTTSGIESTLAVYVNDLRWHETAILDGTDKQERVYITHTGDDDKTTIIFGARTPTGAENIIATYRNGIGKPGNVDGGQISILTTRPFGVRSVVNPLPATGGADKESRDQARRNVPLAVLSLDRLVSVQDYADFARTYAGIGKASVAQLSDGRNQLVYLTIAGIDNIPIATTSDLYQNLFRSLRQFGNPSTPLLIALCEVKLLVISANVRVLDDFLWEAVARNIRSALLDAFSFEQRALGQPVYQSEVLSVIQSVAGVSYVELDILDAVDQLKLTDALDKIHQEELKAQTQFGTKPDLTKDLTDLLKLEPNNVVPVSLAMRDADDPTLIHPAQLAFLSPDVPDTLILTELNNDPKR